MFLQMPEEVQFQLNMSEFGDVKDSSYNGLPVRIKSHRVTKKFSEIYKKYGYDFTDDDIIIAVVSGEIKNKLVVEMNMSNLLKFYIGLLMDEEVEVINYHIGNDTLH